LYVWDPEVGLGVAVGADVDAVDELVEDLLDHVGTAFADGSSDLGADGAQLRGGG
jgi:tetrahydromethanopterin S-methyltransferase subunit F